MSGIDSRSPVVDRPKDSMKLTYQIVSPEKPRITEELALEILKKYYEINASFARELDSFGDQNYYMKALEAFHKENKSLTKDNEFILKIMNSDDSASVDVIRAQNKCMLFLKERGISCSFPLLSSSGRHTVFMQDNSSVYAVRLMNFLPGQMLKDALKNKSSFAPKLLYKTGQFIAQLDKELEDFKDENLLCLTQSNYDLQNFSRIEPYIQPKYIKNKTDLDGIVHVFQKYMEIVPPVLNQLPKQVIHNDAHDMNILLKDDSLHIIDFGDVCYSYRVFEVAIAMSHIITSQPFQCAGRSSLDNAGCLLRGYQSILPLGKKELDVIGWCIAGRLVLLSIYGSIKLSMQPENDYVKEILQPVWGALRHFVSIDHSVLLDTWINVED